VVVAGATLGMLVEAATSVDALGDGVVDRLVAAGRDGIVDVTGRLSHAKDRL
jgi:mannose/fructose-specific phosphotransferase system component IIA